MLLTRCQTGRRLGRTALVAGKVLAGGRTGEVDDARGALDRLEPAELAAARENGNATRQLQSSSGGPHGVRLFPKRLSAITQPSCDHAHVRVLWT